MSPGHSWQAAWRVFLFDWFARLVLGSVCRFVPFPACVSGYGVGWLLANFGGGPGVPLGSVVGSSPFLGEGLVLVVGVGSPSPWFEEAGYVGPRHSWLRALRGWRRCWVVPRQSWRVVLVAVPCFPWGVVLPCLLAVLLVGVRGLVAVVTCWVVVVLCGGLTPGCVGVLAEGAVSGW